MQPKMSITLTKIGLGPAFSPEKILACGHCEIGISGIKNIEGCAQIPLFWLVLQELRMV